MPARFDNTRTVEISRPQPPSQPSHGPKAFVHQVNVVPESGMALLSSRYPIATSTIGMKPAKKIAGNW